MGEKINPFYKTGKKMNPFYKVDNITNGADRFVILSTTENGKYVRGNLLFYSMNGVEIYTDINNAILVDTINKTFTVRKADSVLEEINPTDPEQRQYVIIMVLDDDINNEDINKYIWASMIGRTTMYEYIKENIEINYINPDKSIILTDNVALKDALSVTQFIKYLKNGNLVEEDDFDIDEYRGVED